MSAIDDIGPDGLTDQQRAAGYAPRRHSVAYGARRQPDIATPLTEAELAIGGGYGPAITDVDCTPRPRYGESQAKFLARMASYGANVEVLKREMRQRNRAAALKQGTWPDGAVYRAQAHAGKATMPAKRTTPVLKPALVEHRLGADEAREMLTRSDEDEKLVASLRDIEDLDDATKRFALLEMGTKP